MLLATRKLQNVWLCATYLYYLHRQKYQKSSFKQWNEVICTNVLDKQDASSIQQSTSHATATSTTATSGPTSHYSLRTPPSTTISVTRWRPSSTASTDTTFSGGNGERRDIDWKSWTLILTPESYIISTSRLRNRNLGLFHSSIVKNDSLQQKSYKNVL